MVFLAEQVKFNKAFDQACRNSLLRVDPVSMPMPLIDRNRWMYLRSNMAHKCRPDLPIYLAVPDPLTAGSGLTNPVGLQQANLSCYGGFFNRAPSSYHSHMFISHGRQHVVSRLFFLHPLPHCQAGLPSSKGEMFGLVFFARE